MYSFISGRYPLLSILYAYLRFQLRNDVETEPGDGLLLLLQDLPHGPLDLQCDGIEHPGRASPRPDPVEAGTAVTLEAARGDPERLAVGLAATGIKDSHLPIKHFRYSLSRSHIVSSPNIFSYVSSINRS